MLIFLFLLIYEIGIIATLWIDFYKLDSGTETTLLESLFAIIRCASSWLGFIIVIMIIYGDKRYLKRNNYGRNTTNRRCKYALFRR